MEDWKDIVGYENIYQVSNNGNIRVLNYRHRGYAQIVKQGMDYYGYPKIRLAKNGVRKEYKVHRLTAQAFLDNKDCLPEVNHKDYNRKNNDINNLEWVSKIDNIKHQLNRRELFKAKKVMAISINRDEYLLFNSVSEASRALKIPKCCISYCIDGKMPNKKGYILKGA